MIDLTKLDYHVAARDSSGRPVLLPKAKPLEYAGAGPVGRRAYAHAEAKEFEAVGAAARNAAMPAQKPENWDRASAISKRTWHLEAQRAVAKGEL